MGCLSSKYVESEAVPKSSSAAPGAKTEIRGLGRVEDKEVQERSRKALRSLFATKSRDYLVDGNGKKVKVDQLKGLSIGLLFSAHAVPAARGFTKVLNQVYRELKADGKGMEVIFFSNDDTPELWQQSLIEMGWLALPYNEQETSDALGEKFEVRDIPTLIILDSEGQLVTKDGVELIQTYGAKAFPFTQDRVRSLQSGMSQDLASEKNRVSGTTQGHKSGPARVSRPNGSRVEHDWAEDEMTSLERPGVPQVA
eukprot:jgi/Mesen1/4291/ME000022S03572